MEKRSAYIYILASKSGVLYTGVTSDLVKRIYQHKNDFADGFTKKYKVHKLVYWECLESIFTAIEGEKQSKKYSRKKKENLVINFNPSWDDLYH